LSQAFLAALTGFDPSPIQTECDWIEVYFVARQLPFTAMRYKLFTKNGVGNRSTEYWPLENTFTHLGAGAG
jgi:hypothetical protein